MRDNATVDDQYIGQVRSEGKAETTYAAHRNPTATSTSGNVPALLSLRVTVIAAEGGRLGPAETS